MYRWRYGGCGFGGILAMTRDVGAAERERGMY